MGRAKRHEKPQMRRVVKGSGEYARARYGGREFFLGKWGTREAIAAYDALLLRILSGAATADAQPQPASTPPDTPLPAGQTPERQPEAPQPAAPAPVPASITVLEVADRYVDHCLEFYRMPNGKPGSTYDTAKQAARAVREFHDTPADTFGPRKLTAVLDLLVREKRPRKTCNRMAQAVRRMFKWAAAQELVPASVFDGLATVELLRRGRTAAAELPKVKPVDDATVDATLPFMSPLIADMVRIQRLTGCRPGELCIIRPADIDQSDAVWVYRPHCHKTAWRDKEREIYIGPRAQAILTKYLNRAPERYCFSPKQEEHERARRLRARRATPMTPSQRARKKKTNRGRAPSDHYTNASYRRAITRAVNRANRRRKREADGGRFERLENWAPNRLRHTVGTEVRRAEGLEAAQVILGHSHADVTQVYAESNRARGKEVMLRYG